MTTELDQRGPDTESTAEISLILPGDSRQVFPEPDTNFDPSSCFETQRVSKCSYRESSNFVDIYILIEFVVDKEFYSKNKRSTLTSDIPRHRFEKIFFYINFIDNSMFLDEKVTFFS
jgi:hypothetical protein